MLAEEASSLKQKKREEQLRNWKEREKHIEESSATTHNNSTSSSSSSSSSNNENNSAADGANSKHRPPHIYHIPSKVRFPKGCIFLSACSSSDIDEVRQHLKMGVNINTTNIDGLTALHQACIDANIDMVKFLAENNADINAQDNEGWTPLHAAVSVGNLELTKFLISRGAKLNICNYDGDLPIDVCEAINTEMKEFIEEEMTRQSIDADFEKRKEELIMYEDAVGLNFKDKIHTKTGATPLHVSAAKGYSRVIKLLIQSGANVNAVDKDGWTPLHAAAHWEQEEACKILAENGASFDTKNFAGQTPLEVCDNQMATKLKVLQSNCKILVQQNVQIKAAAAAAAAAASAAAAAAAASATAAVEKTASEAAAKNETRKNLSTTTQVASKDEQAELIRKQKAKLERHFRRSTQAVSYDDIKNAEATIKGNQGSNLVQTIEQQRLKSEPSVLEARCPNTETSNTNDYSRKAYEQMKKENELLHTTISKLRKELDEHKKNQSNINDKKEKRASERRISELEEEVKQVEILKQDNLRLKEENAALIRVISKLSK